MNERPRCWLYESAGELLALFAGSALLVLGAATVVATSIVASTS